MISWTPNEGTRCRIYAPVGAHRDLLAYLVRRLLENGANSSFVNQIVDEDVPPEVVARDPFDALNDETHILHLPTGPDLFLPERVNSMGFDLRTSPHSMPLTPPAAPSPTIWHVDADLMAGKAAPKPPEAGPSTRPDPVRQWADVATASAADIDSALASAVHGTPAPKRGAKVLNKDRRSLRRKLQRTFRSNPPRGGQTVLDAVAELREAVDFLRYYAANAPKRRARGHLHLHLPWNFPLAIFTGQISAPRLAAGNAVLVKTGRADADHRPQASQTDAQGGRARKRAATPARRRAMWVRR